MALWEQFCGGAYRARSPNLDSESCINLYLDTIHSTTNAKKACLVGTPGLRLLATAGTLSCRGIFELDGRIFTVIGATFYEVIAGVPTVIGTVANDGKLATFASNGRGGEQLCIVSGGYVYIFRYTTNVFTGPVSVPLTNPAVMVSFLDGYFLILEQNTIRIWFCALENGLVWNALDFFARSQTSDNVIGMAIIRDRIWTFGSQTSEIFYDSGTYPNPFLPYPGSVMMEGTVTSAGIVPLSESFYWLSQDDDGRGQMVAAATNVPQRISTPAIEYALSTYSTLADAEGFAYAAEGHEFVGWTFPSVGVTWVYDTTEQHWHQRAGWNTATGTWSRWKVRGLTNTITLGIICGDYATGDLYYLDPEVFTDNGAIIRRVRRAPYLGDDNAFAFLDQVELGAQTGVGLATGAANAVDPTVELRLSRDAAQTWTSAGTARLGKIGEYLTRVIWRRLGRARVDRLVLEVVVTDPVRVVFGPGLWLRITPGTAQT